ncbi:MAG: 50S ribosomal protein L25 [bacterium]
MADYNLTATRRSISTKGAVNEMRRNSLIPGNYYIKGKEPISISVKENSFKPLVFTAESHLVNLTIDSDPAVRCMVKEVQFHPVTDRIIHFDLMGVSADEVMKIEVPILFIGSAVGVKDGGTLQESLHKLEIECLPKFVPQHIEIDITNLHLGQSIHVADVNLENVAILNGEDVIIVSVLAPRAESESTDEVSETEVIGKGKSENEE